MLVGDMLHWLPDMNHAVNLEHFCCAGKTHQKMLCVLWQVVAIRGRDQVSISRSGVFVCLVV